MKAICIMRNVEDQSFTDWFKQLHLTEIERARHPHVTIVYSKKVYDIFSLTLLTNKVDVKPNSQLTYFVEAKSLCVTVQSYKLHEDHKHWLKCGFTHTFEPYNPHITLAYCEVDRARELMEMLQINKRVYSKPIRLGPEFVKEIQ